MSYIKRYKLGSRILHTLGKKFIGDPKHWNFGHGIEVSSEEFYMLPEDRPIANPMLRNERARWEMMVRNAYIDYIRRKVLARVSLVMTAVAVSTVLVANGGVFAINTTGAVFSSIKAASAERAKNKERIEELEESIAALKEVHAAEQMPTDQYEQQVIALNEQLMSMKDKRKYEKYEEKKQALYKEGSELEQQLSNRQITREEFELKSNELRERMRQLQLGEVK